MNYTIAAATDVGIKRKGKPNEDAVAIIKAPPLKSQPTLCVIADGMGGYIGGAKASALVIRAFKSSYKQSFDGNNVRAFLESCVHKAHGEVKAFAAKKPEFTRMGSTLVAALVDEKRILHVLNVGDCRAYVVDGGGIKQVTEDQSMVAEMVRRGILTKEESRNHPERNKVSMSINAKRPKVEPNYVWHKLERDERVILCSDGVWGVLTDRQLHTLVTSFQPKQAVEKAIELANVGQGPDNMSIVVIAPNGVVLKQDNDETNPGL